MRVFITVLALVIGGSSAWAGSPTEITFTTRGGGVVVAATIAGQGPFKFLLDTGSTRTAITASLASRLKLTAVARTALVTAAGSTVQPVVRISNITVGGDVAADLLALTLPFSTALGDLDGILGQDFLAPRVYTIDYQHHRLRFNDVSEGRHEVRLTLQQTEGRFLVELPQASAGGAVVRLVPDSGANAVVIFEGAGRFPLAIENAGGAVATTTASGGINGRAVIVKRLQVGQTSLENQPGTAIHREGANAPDGDGLLPLWGFASVTFNGPEGYLVVRGR